MPGRITAILVAGGSSSRMGFDKLTFPLHGKSVLYRSAEALCSHPLVSELVVVTRKERVEAVREELAPLSGVTQVVAGGKERQDSVLCGLRACGDAEYIAIHDAARPFVSKKVLDAVFQKAFETGAAAPAVPVKDTVKYAPDGLWVEKTPARAALFAVQTPQVFRKTLYEEALQKTAGQAVTDDCSILEKAGIPVALTEGSYENYKITTREDIPKENTMRIGHGYDVHRLTEGRKLILGGIEIPFEKGLLGHSDADVLTHAVMDALLGAAAMGDIGQHFPDSDPAYKDADSVQLLRRVMGLLHKAGYKPVNLDATILCQRPKLAGYLPDIRKNLADAMDITVEDIHVKATTEEGLGFTGTGEGIAVHCVCLIEKE